MTLLRNKVISKKFNFVRCRRFQSRINQILLNMNSKELKYLSFFFIAFVLISYALREVSGIVSCRSNYVLITNKFEYKIIMFPIATLVNNMK
jgi:hypothetical protein